MRHLAATAKQLLFIVVVSSGAIACAAGAAARRVQPPTEATMSDAQEFDFTEAEMYAALRLVVPEEEARQSARAFAQAHEPGMDWGTSEKTLLLLSLATETGHARVERIRRADQESRYSIWLVGARSRHGGSAAELSRTWADLIADEDREWEKKRSELRRSLQEQERIPPDQPG